MRTIAFMNLKGGTAKTVSSINTAAILARDYCQNVLLIDADSQGNLTEFVSIEIPNDRAPGGVADLLTGRKASAAATKLDRVKILQADPTLMALDVSKAGSGEADPMAMADWLAARRQSYDWVIIDCPPAFSAAAMAALIAADEVVIPMKLDAFGIRGMSNLMEQIRNMKRINEDLQVAGVLPTMWYNSPQMRASETGLQESLDRAGIRVFHHIRSSRKMDEMTFAQRPLIYSSPRCPANWDYKTFVKELYADEAEGGEQDGI